MNIEQKNETGKNNRLRLIFWLSFLFAVFQLVVPVFFRLYDLQLRSIHVFFGLSLILLLSPSNKNKDLKNITIMEIILITIIFLANLNIFVNWKDIYMYSSDATLRELFLGGALMILIVDLSRRATGWGIPVCVMGIFAYVFMGPLLPGSWAHPGFPLEFVISGIYKSSLGIYGSITGNLATYISMFLIFGALLSATGIGKTFIDLALLIAGRFTGGPAKVAVVASSMFGSISGSTVANVSLTGSYTIPLMTSLGYNPNFAGGVEAMASAGGGITPPIMGISAFVMAALINVPYINIIGYALIPCFLFYTSVMSGIHFRALQIGLKPAPADKIPEWKSVVNLPRLLPLFGPMAILILLLLRGFALITSGFYACVFVIIFYVFSDFSFTEIKKKISKLPSALSEGGKSIARIVPLLVAVNIFINLLGITGVAPKLSALILRIGGTSLIGALLVSGLLPFLLGSALPTVATYILSAALIAPALARLNLDLVAIHLFLIYWSTLSCVTPPTCTGSIIAANIGGGNWLKVSFNAMRLGIVVYIVPFFFVLQPALIGKASFDAVLTYGISALIGTVFLSSGIFGYFNRNLDIITRVLFISGGLLLLFPDGQLTVVGIGMIVMGFLIGLFLKKKAE
jgi:TRAP transporter 4TM/12TM fusion protein